MNRDRTSPIVYSYSFTFKDGSRKEFTVSIEPGSLNIIGERTASPSTWTLLENFRCPHCPLPCGEGIYCPLAVNLEEIIRFFSNSPSYEMVDVEIKTDCRTFIRNTSLQESVSGLIGILMVTSGCPVMGKLKPMVRFHLPFSGLLETEFRAISMYLLGQYFFHKKGLNADWDLHGLARIYDDIRVLNRNVVRRIADIEKQDTSINSLIVLNNFAEYVTVSLSDEMLDELETLYREYMQDEELLR